MRIGIYTEIYKPVTNGVVVSVESFRKQLESLGHEVFVFTPAFQSYNDPHVLTFASLPLPTNSPYRLTTPFRNFDHLPRLDVVHAQSLFMTGWLALMHARTKGLPLVFTYHTRLADYSHYVPVLPDPMAKKMLINSSRRYCNRADRVVVPSSPIRELLRSYGVKTPMDVVPTPAALPPPAPDARQQIRARYGIESDRITLLNVGRLAHEKSVDVLLDAFARLPARRPHLLLVGDGPMREALEAQANELGVRADVSFVGMVERREIAAYYAASDLFVFTSSTETQGLVLDEALQMSLPVVAIAAGGVIDALQSKGTLAVRCGVQREAQVAALTKVLKGLLTEPSRLAALREEVRNSGLHVPSGAELLVRVYERAQAEFVPRLFSRRRPGVRPSSRV
jgi:glycosyltransferase involved in cell wall biosynthesis